MPGLAGTATTFPDRALAADVSTIVTALRRAAILPEEHATDAAGRWAIAAGPATTSACGAIRA